MELSSIEILEVARKRAGLTQKELAKILGISLPTYGRIIAKKDLNEILFLHAVILEKVLKVKFSVSDTDQGRKVTLAL